jgi:hypothetical protein
MHQGFAAGLREEYFANTALSLPVAAPPSAARAFTGQLRL